MNLSQLWLQVQSKRSKWVCSVTLSVSDRLSLARSSKSHLFTVVDSDDEPLVPNKKSSPPKPKKVTAIIPSDEGAHLTSSAVHPLIF